MLETIARVLAELHYQYTEQFLAALVPTSLTVICHGTGMNLVRRYFRRFGSSITPRSVPRTVFLIGIVAIMLVTHYAEIVLWAWFYFWTDMLQDFRVAMLYSVNNYTTVGASDVLLPGRWRGFGGFEALIAILMFGWSTAMLVTVVQKFHNIDK